MSSQTTSLIEIRNLIAGYGSNRVLNKINLTIQPGEFIGVIGPNGSGKSTFLHCLSGILSPTAGEIELAGRPYSAYSRKDLAKKMAVVEAEESLIFQFSVGELVEMGRHPYLKRFQALTSEDQDAINKALSVTRLMGFEDRPINELSSGERQRVFLAKAIAQETGILLLDEPTSHLDLKHQVESFQLMTQLNQESGHTLICISHDLNLASEYCSRLLVFQNGTIAADGNPDDVLTGTLLESVFGKAFVLGSHPESGRPYVIHPAKDQLHG